MRIKVVTYFLIIFLNQSESILKESFEIEYETYVEPYVFSDQLFETYFLKDDELNKASRKIQKCGNFYEQEFYCKVFQKSDFHESISFLISDTPAVIIPPWPAPLPSIGESHAELFEASNSNNNLTTNFFINDSYNGLANSVYAWVKVENVVEGHKVVSQWENLADTGKIYSCHNGICSILVNAKASTEDAKTQTGIAVCSIRKLNKSYGAPQNCRFILLKQNSNQLIQAIVKNFTNAYAMAGREDFQIQFKNLKKPDIEKFLKKYLSYALSSPPFNLEVYNQGDHLVGISDYKRIEPLNRWAKQTVRLFHSGNMANDSIYSIATALYLSAQNSPNSRDWKLPSPQQNTKYLELLIDNLKENLNITCDSFKKVSLRRYEVVCNDYN